jgi:hypothetical protein
MLSFRVIPALGVPAHGVDTGTVLPLTRTRSARPFTLIVIR